MSNEFPTPVENGNQDIARVRRHNALRLAVYLASISKLNVDTESVLGTARKLEAFLKG
jgi:hypothetical protein